MTHRYYDDGDILQIYTIHMIYLFQGENGEFRRKVTPDKKFTPLI